MHKAIIEMPKGTRYKYEVDKESGALKLDRPLQIQVPFNYGFIKDTLAPDGDPLDVFILSSDPIPPLTEVEVEIVGGFICKDGGVSDEKLIGVVKGDGFDFKLVQDVAMQEVISYLSRYKQGFEVGEFINSWSAEDLIVQYQSRP